MKVQKPVVILMVSISLTTFGFLVDSDPVELDIWINALEFSLMTLILFSVITIIYHGSILTYKMAGRLFS